MILHIFKRGSAAGRLGSSSLNKKCLFAQCKREQKWYMYISVECGFYVCIKCPYPSNGDGNRKLK